MPENVDDPPKKGILGFFKLSIGIPTDFDAREKWGSKYDPNNGEPIELRCPSIKKVFNNGKCKCGWVCAFNIKFQYK